MKTDLNTLIAAANECAAAFHAIADKVESRQLEPVESESEYTKGIPDGYRYAGTLADHLGSVKCCYRTSIDRQWLGPQILNGMADGTDMDSAKWHVALPIEAAPVRYYRGQTPVTSDMIWRVSPAGIDCRMAHQSEWMDSICDISSVLHETREIPANEGEIHDLANSITTAFLSDLTDVLEQSRLKIRQTRLRAESGEISPEQAASVVKQVAKSITEFCA